MKARLLNLLTVCCVVLVMISPGLVGWKVWQNHRAWVNAQLVLSDPAGGLDQSLAATPPKLPSMAVAQPLLRSISTAITAPLGFIVSIPLGFCSGLLLNNHYQTRRSTTLRQQVAILEKLWRQSIY